MQDLTWSNWKKNEGMQDLLKWNKTCSKRQGMTYIINKGEKQVNPAAGELLGQIEGGVKINSEKFKKTICMYVSIFCSIYAR